MGRDTRVLNATEVKARLLARVVELKQNIGLYQKLAGFGVRTADIPTLSAKAIKDPCLPTNPRKPNRHDVEVVYEEAL